MSDKRQDLIAIFEFIMSAHKLPTDPIDLISAVIDENRRLDAENGRLKAELDRLSAAHSNLADRVGRGCY